MSNLTEGQLHCSPIRVKSGLSLATIASLLGERLYKGKVPDTGWRSIQDETDCLRTTTAQRPRVGKPSITPETKEHPALLKARFYWDAVDVKIASVLGDSADNRQKHMLNAVDLVLAEEGDGHFSGIYTTRNEREVGGYISKGFRDTFADLDATSTVSFDVLDEAVSSDFFLWLISRYDGDQSLDEELELEIIRTMMARDVLSRATSLTSGAEMDRAELAASVIGAPNKFGPAQFAVSDTSLNLTLELELHNNGSFRIIIGQSEYDDEPGLTRDVKGPRLADDTTFVVLPKLRAAYASDPNWPDPGEIAFRDRAAKILQKILDAYAKEREGETKTHE